MECWLPSQGGGEARGRRGVVQRATELMRLEPFMDGLLRHPKVGASWEGFALAQTEAHLGVRRGESHFWATHGGAELDLLVVR